MSGVSGLVGALVLRDLVRSVEHSVTGGQSSGRTILWLVLKGTIGAAPVSGGLNCWWEAVSDDLRRCLEGGSKAIEGVVGLVRW